MQPIEADVQVIEQSRADRPVPAETDIVGKPRLKEIRVQRRGDGPVAVQLLLVPAAVRKEELVVNSPILIDAERHRGVALRIDRLENKIVFESERWIGMNVQKRQHILRDSAKRGGDFVARKRRAALDSTYRLRRGRVKDLAEMNLRAVARVEHRNRRSARNGIWRSQPRAKNC